MHVTAKDRIHYPGFQIVALDARDRTVVFDAKKHHATAQVCHRDDFLGELFGPDVIALELDTRVLSVRDGFQ